MPDIDMNPHPRERLNLAKEALRTAKTDWYRTKLNQPENAQKGVLLADLEARAQRATEEIAVLEKEVEALAEEEAKIAAALEKKAAAEAKKAEAETKKDQTAAEREIKAAEKELEEAQKS